MEKRIVESSRVVAVSWDVLSSRVEPSVSRLWLESVGLRWPSFSSNGDRLANALSSSPSLP